MFPPKIHLKISGSILGRSREIEWWKTFNPCYEIHLHDECEEDGHPIFKTPYAKYLSREEAFRVGILMQYGGWFFPPGVWPVLPLSQLEIDLEEQEMVVSPSLGGVITILGADYPSVESFDKYSQIRAHPELFPQLVKILTTEQISLAHSF